MLYKWSLVEGRVEISGETNINQYTTTRINKIGNQKNFNRKKKQKEQVEVKQER